MKKFFTVLAVLLAAGSMLFAAEGRIGVSASPEWFWYTDADDVNKVYFNLMAEGVNYFGKDGGGFGVEYGLGAAFPVSDNFGSVTIEFNESSVFLFKAGLAYKYAFSDMFGLSAGLGVMGNVNSRTYTSQLISSLSATYTTFTLDVYGRVGADIDLLDFLGLSVGVNVGGPVYTNSVLKSGDSSLDLGDMFGGNEPVSGVWLAPYVAVSFLY